MPFDTIEKRRAYDKKRNATNYRKEYRKNQMKRYLKNNKLYKSRQSIRHKTYYKYGKLDKGLSYHHFIPYNEDNFIILEKGFHQFYHDNSDIFNMFGRI